MSLSRCIFKMVNGEGLQWRILSSGGWLSIWNTTIWRAETFWSPNHRVTARVKLPQIIGSLLVKLGEFKEICATHQRVRPPIPNSEYSRNLDQLVQIFFMFCSDWPQILWKVGICDWKFVQRCGEQLFFWAVFAAESHFSHRNSGHVI